MTDNELKINIILALQGALLGNVSQHVRIICCDWAELNWFKLKFYLDVEPTEIEKELMSIVLTEFESNIQAFSFNFEKYFEEITFSEEPFEKLEKLRLVVYWRNEIPVF